MDIEDVNIEIKESFYSMKSVYIQRVVDKRKEKLKAYLEDIIAKIDITEILKKLYWFRQ